VNPHSKGTLPVYWAATLGHVETVKVLVDVGTRMTVGGMGTKITAQKLAVCQGKLDAIRLIAQCGANVDASTDDDDGNKAVHLTALNDQADVDGNWERICQPPRASVQLMSANNSSVCVNAFTPLQLSVEYENAAVERVGLQHTSPPPPGVCAACGQWWCRHGVPAVCTLQVCQVLQQGVSAHTLAHAQGELRGGLGQLGARSR
jgi:hypothetical protein